MENIVYEHFRDFAQKTYLIEVEHNNCDLHCHRNLELLYMERGSMTGEINNTEYTYTEDDVILIPSFNSHIFKTPPPRIFQGDHFYHTLRVYDRFQRIF